MNLRNSAVVLAALILAASCTSGTEGIFASIEREQKIVSLGGLSKTATVYSMAELGGTYYATGGKALFTRAVTGTAWDKGTVAGKTEVLAVGATSTDIFAVAAGTLYRLVGGTWTAVTVPGGLVARDLVPIRASNGYDTSELVLVAENGGLANTVFRIQGAAVNPTGLDLKGTLTFDLPIATGSVLSAATDGTNYYLASKSFLWKVNSGFSTATRMLSADLVGLPLSEYSGLIFQGSKLYVGTSSVGSVGGGIYSTDPTLATWTFTTIASGVKVGSAYPVAFGQFLYNDVNNSLWVATGATVGQEGNGYMEIASGALSQIPNTDSNNYTSSAIKTFSVGTLFKGSSGYFLGTVAHGLWTWDSTKKVWSQQ